MTSLLSLLGTFVLFALWQSTFWLAAAWVCGMVYRRMPWKTHTLYVTGIFAATFTPLLSTIISITEGGILPFANPLGSEQMIERIEPAFIGQFCLAGMLLFLAVLLYGIASSRKLMFRAVPFPDQESQHTLLRHSKMLRNVSLPVLFTSPNIKSPTVWCWGLHPAVLLPESLATQRFGFYEFFADCKAKYFCHKKAETKHLLYAQSTILEIGVLLIFFRHGQT